MQSTKLKEPELESTNPFNLPSVPSTPISSYETPEVVRILSVASPIGEKHFPEVPKDEPVLKLAEPAAIVAVPHEAVPVNENPFADPVAKSEEVRPAVLSTHSDLLDAATPEVTRESTPVLDVRTLSPRPVSLQASYITDNNINDGHVFPPGAEFVKSWLMSNSGDIAWPETTELVFIGGDRLSSGSVTKNTYPIGRVEPGAEVDVHAYDMKAPEEPGRYVSHWRLSDGEGKPFGDQLWCE